jgi:SAM-dependent methyltransferase
MMLAALDRVYGSEHAQVSTVAGLGTWGEKRADFFLDRFPRRTYRSACEIGCGDGYMLHRFGARGVRRLLGIDPSASAQSRYPGVETLRAFVGDGLSLGGETFDIIFSSSTFEHIGDLAGVFAFCRRSLSEGGVLFFEVPDVDPQFAAGDPGVFIHQHVHYFSIPVMRSLLARCGFAKVDIVCSAGSMFVTACPGDGAVVAVPRVETETYGARLREKLRMIKDAETPCVLHGVNNALNNVYAWNGGLPAGIIADNDETKHGKCFFGREVFPSSAVTDAYGTVIVTTRHFFDAIAEGYRSNGFSGKIVCCC